MGDEIMNELKLDKLINEYVNILKNDSSKETAFKEREERRKYYQSYNYEKIINMTDNEVIAYIKKLWSVLPIQVNKIYDKNGHDNFKKSLADLLYGTDDISIRYDRFHTTIYEFKASAMSEVLTYNYPNEYMIWNSKVKRVFTMLGIKDIPEANDNLDYNWYTKLIKYSRAIQSKLSQKMGKEQDLLDTDNFYEVIYSNNSISYENLKKIVNSYKSNLNSYLPEETYKFEAIKHFKDNWNIESSNFTEMLKKSLSQAGNLLVATMYFPGRMIIGMSEKEPETVRNMFRELFNEDLPLEKRFINFTEKSDELLKKYWEPGKNHYQDTHTISVYLNFMYPEKYCIYKSSIANKAAKEMFYNLQMDTQDIKNKAHKQVKILENYFRFCEYIYDYICDNSSDLFEKFDGCLTENSYRDDKHLLLVSDLIYYIGTKYRGKKYWILSAIPENKNEWEEFKNNNIIRIGWEKLGDISELNTKNEIKDILNKHYPGDGSRKNDVLAIYDFAHTMDIDDIVIIKNGKYGLYGYGKVTSDYRHEDNKNVRSVEWVKTGEFKAEEVAPGGGFAVKTLTDITEYDNGEWPKQIIKYIDNFSNSSSSSFSEETIIDNNANCYMLCANPRIWSFNDIKVGETIEYTSLSQNGNKRKVYQNYVDSKVGDNIIVYESTPTKAIVGLCSIVEKKENNNIVLKKQEELINIIPYGELKEFEELKESEFFKIQQGSLYKLTKEEYIFLMDVIRENNPKQNNVYLQYTKQDFLNDVFISEPKYEELKNLVLNNNVILKGAPGVGKTFMAKRLAYSIIGQKNSERVTSIQFHQSYSYEDFIEGYKPTDDGGFVLKQGIFYHVCNKAKSDSNNDYFLIIDEINRGNLSKIFGELLMLIEEDKRDDESLKLAYSERDFTVPSNLHIIGMMNTADRSLALMDFALRRRFVFYDIKPAFDNPNFINYQKSLNNEYFDTIIEKIGKLNNDIKEDLDEGFEIGHSYFSNLENPTKNELNAIIKYQIMPTLEEYWFDNKEKYNYWKKEFGVDNE